jgi:glutamate racemase
MIKQPIGVIDSGLGGLTVWKELIKIMPNEDYLYFGDSAFCPYGSKDPDEITRRVKSIVEFLIRKNCKILVIACNAITASSIDALRKNYPIPFIGMEPAIKPALLKTKTKAIGVLATERALKGNLFFNTKKKYAAGIDVIEQIGSGLVEKVEALDFNSEPTREILKKYLSPMIEKNIDHLVLGCTHYPFLQESMKNILGENVVIIDPAPAIAQQTSNILKQIKRKTKNETVSGHSIFLTTGDTGKLQSMLAMITKLSYEVHPISV